MFTGYRDKTGKEIHIGDKWEYHNVVYKVVKGKEVYFEHPSVWASADNDIEIEHSREGEIIAE